MVVLVSPSVVAFVSPSVVVASPLGGVGVTLIGGSVTPWWHWCHPLVASVSPSVVVAVSPIGGVDVTHWWC